VDTAAPGTDYWLSKLFYDLQDAPLAAAYRADPASVIARYPLDDGVRRALIDDDVTVLAPRVNAYLLRYYFGARGMSDDDFIAKIRATDDRG
jgi:hypothetical protein